MRGRFKSFDRNGDNTISSDDVTGLPKSTEAERKEKVLEAIKRLDKDGNGSVSLDEFLQDSEEWYSDENVFKRIDKDHDGSLTLDEYMLSQSRTEEGKERGRKKFETLDADANDLLSLEEFSKLGK